MDKKGSGWAKSNGFVNVTATWCGDDDNYKRMVTRKGKLLFQRGLDFEAEIEIIYP
jgi:hypothetical protein